ncbi:hypothetical protein [Nocardia neocaledoniensis]|uniref:hypothetical protein n=1 Tax=Nocardia neocaledoniensis TaxID=236511 RepID=UPI0024549C6F|nr:hypothetical protein [Nocardia neocaledoniensis]
MSNERGSPAEEVTSPHRRNRRRFRRRGRSDGGYEDGGAAVEVVGGALIEGAGALVRVIGRVLSGLVHALT